MSAEDVNVEKTMYISNVLYFVKMKSTLAATLVKFMTYYIFDKKIG